MKASKLARLRTRFVGGLVGFLIILLSAAGAQAQAPVDTRWTPWLGCWASADAPGDAALLCIGPSEDGEGVEFLSVAEDGRIPGGRVVGDGVPRASDLEGCVGEERAEFSEGGTRVHLHTEHACEGDVRRVSDVVMAMSTPSEWVQVESVVVDGAEATFAQTFRVAPQHRMVALGLGGFEAARGAAPPVVSLTAASLTGMSVTAAASPSTVDELLPLTVDDVIDASSRVDDDALGVWIAMRGEPVQDLSGEDLERMEAAGLTPDVIDVVIAVSYPEHFDVDRAYGSPVVLGGWPDAADASYDRFMRTRQDPRDRVPRTRSGYYDAGRFGMTFEEYFRDCTIVVAPRGNAAYSSRHTPQGFTRVTQDGYSRTRTVPSVATSARAADQTITTTTGGTVSVTSSGSGSSSTGRTAKPKPRPGGGG